jgi:hypothetical protein
VRLFLFYLAALQVDNVFDTLDIISFLFLTNTQSKHSQSDGTCTMSKAAVSSAEKSGEAAVGPPAGIPDPQRPVSEKIRPLSGKPHFSCIMCKSHVQPPFQVVLTS